MKIKNKDIIIRIVAIVGIMILTAYLGIEKHGVNKFRTVILDKIPKVETCNQCGEDITDIGASIHYENSPTIMVNCGTEDVPWWIEAHTCITSHREYILMKDSEKEDYCQK